MIRPSLEVSGQDVLGKAIAEIAGRIEDPTDLHAIAGHVWVFQEMPLVFREQGPGWQRPKFRMGQRLLDTGRLRNSWAYRADARDVVVGTAVRYAKLQQEGGTVRPTHGKWLLRPLSPPLSITEARAFPVGKAAIQAKYPGSKFFLGPEGPGIYRKTGRIAYGAKSRKGHMAWERIAAAMHSSTIPATPMAKKTDRLLAKVAKGWVLWIAKAQGQRPIAEGNPDVGPRGGQQR